MTREEVRLLVVDSASGDTTVVPFAHLARFLSPGDLVVVNDAATYPASLDALTDADARVEVRLFDAQGPTWQAVLFGEGDWRTKTEDRPAPPLLTVGARLRFGALEAHVTEVAAPRRVSLKFDGDADAVWAHVYDHGVPIQYAYRTQLDPLWAFQNIYASRPWAAENPSAGRPLSWTLLLELRRRGVKVEALTHATGLSSTGDAALDASLPWPERYEIPASTASAVNAAVRSGRKVIAVGTSVMRALESSALKTGRVEPGPGVAALVIDPTHTLRVTHGLVTGIHSPQESHYRLLGALVDAGTLRKATAEAKAAGLVEHEEGDAALFLAGCLNKVIRNVDLSPLL